MDDLVGMINLKINNKTMYEIKKEVRKEIVEQLRAAEIEHNVTVLFAIESGSRAWGFESTDSDYDIRFVYAHKSDHYISILDKRDVIEYPIEGLIDINGWDIRKALQLSSKFNPAISEWLKSPITYIEHTDFRKELLALEKEHFSVKNAIYHYLSIANTNYRNNLKSDNVKVKKYFYVLRPLLACMWVEKYNEAPPIEFDKLLESYTDIDPKLKVEILNLLERKKI